MARIATKGGFLHGRKSGIGTTAVQLTTTRGRFRRGVLIKAANGNSGTIYVGTSSSVTADSADATDGFELAAGGSVVVEVQDPSNVFVIASEAGQKVFWTGV